MRKVRGLGAALLLVGAGAAALRCNIWNDGDSSLPLIGYGTFDVTPCGHVFDVVVGASEGGAVAPEFTFLVTGLSQDGLGAESVPVRVSVSRCQDLDAGNAGRTSDAKAAPSALAQDGGTTCLGPTTYESANGFGAIEIDAVGDGGCTSLSQSVASCVLAADGTARFAVRAVLPTVSTQGLAVPVCVSTNGHEVQIPIQIASAVEGGKLDVVAANGGQIVPKPAITVSGCSSLTGAGSVPACQAIPRQLGVSVQLMAGEAGTVSQQPLMSNLTIFPSAGAFLTDQQDCPQSGAAQIEVDFPSGVSASPPLLVCTNGQAGTYQLTASSITDPGVLSGTATIVAAPQPGSVTLTQDGTGAGAATLLDCAGSPIAGAALTITSLDGGVLTEGGATTNASGRLPFAVPAGSQAVRVTVGSTNQTCTGTFQ
jgi:hypothetical protein